MEIIIGFLEVLVEIDFENLYEHLSQLLATILVLDTIVCVFLDICMIILFCWMILCGNSGTEVNESTTSKNL